MIENLFSIWLSYKSAQLPKALPLGHRPNIISFYELPQPAPALIFAGKPCGTLLRVCALTHTAK